MTESSLLRRIMLRLSQAGATVFRNNQGALKDATGRLVRYGVCQPGGADIIGWTSLEITPAMVGGRVAVFTAIEVKTSTGHTSKEQDRFLAAVRLAGGIAGVARSEDEAAAMVRQRPSAQANTCPKTSNAAASRQAVATT